MEDYLGTYKNRPRTVVFYGRVSTEHEQQISALGNQMEWYANLAERNPNWTVVAQYIDEGITGTQMKKRPSFMQILKDVAELESAKQEGLVVEQAYKALRRSYDTKISQEKALLARLRVRRQVLGRGDMFTRRGPPG